MSECVDIKKAALLLGTTERHTRRMCTEGKLMGAVKPAGCGRWKIPVTAHAKLAADSPAEKLPGELEGVPTDKRDRALKRLGLLKKFDQYAAAFGRKGGTATEALARFCTEQKIKKRSFERWKYRFKKYGLIGLVDSRGGGKFISQIISPEAFELFKSMYLTQQQLSVKTCYQNISFVNRDENKGWKIPSLQFFYKFIKRAIPLGVEVLHREGLAAYEAKCAPYITIDPDSVQPGQIWVGDHHQFNCWVRHRGRWIRPWITAWEDMRSRSITGLHISASPNQTTILTATKRAIEKYGPPDSVKIDNGRDYDSEIWTGTTKAKRRAIKKGEIDEQMVAGIYAMMDIAVSFAIPYHPQSKPLERFFDTLDTQFTKTFETYCGKDSARKPEHLNQLLSSEKAIARGHTLESFTKLVAEYVEVYNNTAHTGAGMGGRTPAEVMATRQSRRVLAEGAAELLLRVWSGELVVGKNGVNFKRMWYGQYNMGLAAYQGKKVRVAYDPDDLRQVYVYDAATLKLITIAEQNRLIGYGAAVNEDALREATRQKTRALRINRQFRDSQLTANMDLTSLTLKAMAEGSREPEPQKTTQTLRPVVTPMNEQVAEHKRKEMKKTVKKAAGAESVSEVLDMDFTMLKRTSTIEGEKLFDD